MPAIPEKEEEEKEEEEEEEEETIGVSFSRLVFF